MELDFCDGDLLPVEDESSEDSFEIDGDYLLPVEESFGEIWEEGFASRFFRIGDRIKVYYKNDLVHGQVVDKYPHSRDPKLPPRFLMRSDRKIDNNPDAFLGGFGLELSVETSPFVIFENEVKGGDPIYGYYRQMTFQEAWDDCRSLEYG